MNPSDSESGFNPQLNPVAVFSALGNDVRWSILKLLADGRPRITTEIAAAMKRDFDGVSKHLRLMRDAGVLKCEQGEDRRLLFFSIPPERRRDPGQIDFGVCTVQMSSVATAIAKD